ncbi:MAG: HD domain-containing protein [Bacilli bacterium]|nr:HD domain-containing protein [Bacilli bacterium]MDD4809348.1 HD domain-containing protein [Bacilli bacterium]
MQKMIEDKDYMNIVKYILEDKQFKKMSNISHHCSNRYEHSLKVSYYSYKLAKLLRLNSEEAARAGLLHDFYFESIVDLKGGAKKIKLFTTEHPKQAVENAKEYFTISEKEEDIIVSHMFPFDFRLPKYMESWIVNLTDTVISIFEFSRKFSYKFSYITNLYIILILNSLK